MFDRQEMMEWVLDNWDAGDILWKFEIEFDFAGIDQAERYLTDIENEIIERGLK